VVLFGSGNVLEDRFLSFSHTNSCPAFSQTCVSQSRWSVLISLMKHSCTAALKRLNTKPPAPPKAKKGRKRDFEVNENNDIDKPVESVRKEWIEMSEKVHHLECQLKNTESPVAFSFVEGSLVRALREGQCYPVKYKT